MGLWRATPRLSSHRDRLPSMRSLDGQSFLAQLRSHARLDGSVLETIMTAPMVVAHWINMQYYASTVDNDHFGSGNKTVHNVVGRFGILSGNGGDLHDRVAVAIIAHR